MKIAILDDYQDVVKTLDCFKLLDKFDVQIITKTFKNIHQLSYEIDDCEALVLIRERTKITSELLSLLPKLKIISQTGRIGSHIDLEACKLKNIKVMEGLGSPIAPAELCWTLIMNASRNITLYNRLLLDNKWQNSGSLGIGRNLNGLTLGIWGYGKIGKQIAQFGKVFNMNIIIWGSKESRHNAKTDGFLVAESKEEFFKDSDILTLHLKLNNITKQCVKKEDLELMKEDSLFVNISRAELVEEKALYNELSSNPTKRAALDVYENEPITKETEPLLNLINVLSTPHLGFVEKNSYELYFEIAFKNILKL